MFTRFNHIIDVMIPQYTTSEYGRNEVDGYIHHERRAEISFKNSKKFNVRFLHGSEYDGIAVLRKEDIVKDSTRIRIDDKQYSIESMIPAGDKERYYEILFKEATE
jgi:hypothetical protein